MVARLITNEKNLHTITFKIKLKLINFFLKLIFYLKSLSELLIITHKAPTFVKHFNY